MTPSAVALGALAASESARRRSNGPSLPVSDGLFLKCLHADAEGEAGNGLPDGFQRLVTCGRGGSDEGKPGRAGVQGAKAGSGINEQLNAGDCMGLSGFVDAIDGREESGGRRACEPDGGMARGVGLGCLGSEVVKDVDAGALPGYVAGEVDAGGIVDELGYFIASHAEVGFDHPRALGSEDEFRVSRAGRDAPREPGAAGRRPSGAGVGSGAG